MPDPLEVSCLRCKRMANVYTVPLQMPAAEQGWQSLCAACFRSVLGIQPTEELALQRVRGHHRGRRR